MRFSDIPGLQETKLRLVKSVKNNHVAHAQLFSGQEGVANLTMALAYTSYINCEQPLEDDSCGRCPSCIKIDKLVHPDVNFVFPVATTDKFKKDPVSSDFMKEWRAFILENLYGSANDWLEFYGFKNKHGNIAKEESRQIIKALSLKAFEAKYKVMLIWLPEYMHPSAANAILKILEEPAEGTLFLLVSNQYDRLLTTITSRTQLVTIPGISDQELQSFLEMKGLSPDKAEAVAIRADGSIGKALKVMNEEEDSDTKIDLAEWIRNCWKMNFRELTAIMTEFSNLNRIAQKAVLTELLGLLRNVLMASNQESLIRVSEHDRKFILDFSKTMTLAKLEYFTSEVDDCIRHLDQYASPKILFMDLSLKTMSILKAK